MVCKTKCKSSNYGLWNKKLNEDISVPRSKLPEALDEIYKIGENMVSSSLFWTCWRWKYSRKCYGKR